MDEWIYGEFSRANLPRNFGQVPPGFAASIFFHGGFLLVFPHANQAGFKLHDTGLAGLELS